jgi:N-acetyl-gamma-glutamyl-phosphate reductase
MLKVGIIGASGYTGVELLRILGNHPKVNLTVATSRQYCGTAVHDVFPSLLGISGLTYENPPLAELAGKADLFFTAVPHQTAMDLVPDLLESGKRVIDLSADFRLSDLAVYEKWYQPHTSPQYLTQAVYGLPELNRGRIQGGSLVANPGCYPTSIILALAPLLKENCIDTSTIIADSKSGTSGAGRGASTATLFCEVHDGFKPYKVARTHRHTPEIEQELSILAGHRVKLSFTPHLLPISRGILSTVYASLGKDISEGRITELYGEFYQNEPFVRVLPGSLLPSTQNVRGSNYCDIAVRVDTETNRVIAMSAIDNIVKGAAGQAVQNMNIIAGFDETTGLNQVPLFP